MYWTSLIAGGESRSGLTSKFILSIFLNNLISSHGKFQRKTNLNKEILLKDN